MLVWCTYSHVCVFFLQETKVEFVNNLADSGGSAIFANDLNRCKWLGNAEAELSETTFIFNPKNENDSPFNLTYVYLILYMRHDVWVG